MSDTTWLERAKALRDELVTLRRDFHLHPELSFQEQRTAAKGEAWLRGLGLEVETGIAGTHGVVATLDSGRPGPTVLIRGDMDALPILEETGAPYASETAGVMHACGHDAHTTCALGTAKLLSGHKEAFRGKVKFLLQPAEESPPGGAKVMVEQGGILEGVDAALALHVHAGIPVGKLGFRAGKMLACSSRFEVTIKGVGGHAARPHQAVDSVVVAAQAVQALQTLVSRESNPVEPVVITIGSIHGGTAPNVIAGSVTLQGTTRALDDATAQALTGKIERVLAGVCAAGGATYTMDFEPGYPALVTDVPFTHRAMASAGEVLGRDAVTELADPEMGGEDFAYIAQRVPSVFIRLGVRNEARGIIHPVHSSRFDLDEAALPIGVATLAAVAMDYLNGEA